MIKFEKFTLENGLRVIFYPRSTPIVGINIMYNIGSRDENEKKTGFAHLFEHLMFGGSKNISNYDKVLQNVGGINNAYTTSDITNYYCIVPASNIETALWLESDRMLELSFDPNVLKTQKKVVIEEFNEGLNKPFGDYWKNLCSIMYKKHPYRWPTIGMDVSHIENATMKDVKNFFYKFYRPNNAIMVISGGISFEKVKRLSEKWFSKIPQGEFHKRNLPVEPIQLEPRKKVLKRKVPMNAIYKAYRMCEKYSVNYYPTDLLCGILGYGKSSRLYEKLVNERKLFSKINSYVSGCFDPGLLIIVGYMNEKVSFDEAEKAIDNEIELLQKKTCGPKRIK